MKVFRSHLIIITIVWSLWLILLGYSNALSAVLNYFEMSLTMLVGSFVAGSTSLGGGAVAFPVFTKLLNINSETALVFSLAIQSIGMTSASILIFANRIPIEKRVIIFSAFSGAAGMFLGLFVFRDFLSEASIKYLFSCFSFFVAAALSIYYSSKGSAPFSDQKIKVIYIFIAGFIGGILSGIIGTGIDFIVFTLMIFFYGVKFKVAIATSVVAMAINALLGFLMILIGSDLFQGDVVDYWHAAIPAVVVGAPLGAIACKVFSEKYIFIFLLALIFIDVMSTLIIMGIKLEFILPLLIFTALLGFYKKCLS